METGGGSATAIRAVPPSRLKRHGVGRSRIDLLVRKPYGDGLLQREAIELKVWHPGRPDPFPTSITHTTSSAGRAISIRRA